MSINQALAALACHRSTLYDMLADGRLTNHRIGEHPVFWRAEVERLAEARKIALPPRA
jgi:excisionase family DNA binding protein